MQANQYQSKGGYLIMFVLIKCDTCRVGTSLEEVYEFDDNTTEDQLQEYADDLARDNADSYGIIDDEIVESEESGIEFEEGSCYWATVEVLDNTREEILEKYGDIYEP